MIGSIEKPCGKMRGMYDVSGKILNEMKIVYINSLASVKVKKVGEKKYFRIDRSVRQRCIMSFLSIQFA